MKDLTVISNVLMADGIGRQGIGLIGALQNSLEINSYQLGAQNYKDIPKDTMKILAKPFDGFGKVAFWTYILGLDESLIPLHKAITSPIKMAYSMFESDAIPQLWVKILNDYYDLVVVPDQWLVKIYQNSGVKIPIFVVPLGILIEEFLAQPLKTKLGLPFVYGMSAGLWERKNHIKVLQAFQQLHGNDHLFKLKLHSRFGSYRAQVVQAVTEANLNNVELITQPLSQTEYLTWMKELDCYVFPSQGEGFSVTPREAMALGIPCLISNNSAQHTICRSDLVTPINTNYVKPAKYEVFGNQIIGNYHDCSVEELSQKMTQVEQTYEDCLMKSARAREWSKRYLWSSLKDLYLSLFKPASITMGPTNLVTLKGIITNNIPLYTKLNRVFS